MPSSRSVTFSSKPPFIIVNQQYTSLSNNQNSPPEEEIMGACSAVLLILVTIFIPPVGVFLVAGCGMDLFINICLTILGYLPGHVHAFYLEYVYYQRKGERRSGVIPAQRAPMIYSDRVQGNYGTTGVV